MTGSPTGARRVPYVAIQLSTSSCSSSTLNAQLRATSALVVTMARAELTRRPARSVCADMPNLPSCAMGSGSRLHFQDGRFDRSRSKQRRPPSDGCFGHQLHCDRIGGTENGEPSSVMSQGSVLQQFAEFQRTGRASALVFYPGSEVIRNALSCESPAWDISLLGASARRMPTMIVVFLPAPGSCPSYSLAEPLRLRQKASEFDACVTQNSHAANFVTHSNTLEQALAEVVTGSSDLWRCANNV